MRSEDWTADRIQQLRTSWEDGASAKQIAQQLGLTKGQVIGKAHRLGLSARRAPIARKPNAARPARTSAPTDPVLDGIDKRRLATAEQLLPDLWRRGEPVSRICQVLSLRRAVVLALVEAWRLPPRMDLVVVAPAPPIAAPPPPAPPAPPPVVPVPPSAAVPAVAAPVAKPPAPVRRLVGIDPPAREPPACRWPIGHPGQPGFRFCGENRPLGRSYCDRHHAVAFDRKAAS